MECGELLIFLALTPFVIKEAEQVSAGLGPPILCNGRVGPALSRLVLVTPWGGHQSFAGINRKP